MKKTEQTYYQEFQFYAMTAEVPLKVGFRGSDLWQAALKGDLKKVEKLVKSGADVTFMKDNKPMVRMVHDLEMANQTSGDAAKLYYYRQIKAMLQNKLNSSVLADVAAGDLGRVRTLTQTGADIYQEGKVIFQAVGAQKDSPEIVTWLLSNNQRNEECIEMIQPDGKTLLAEAERTNNANSAKAVKAHINFVVVRESEAGNLPRIQALINLGRDIKYKRADGLTALMTAVMKKRIDVVNVLLSSGADITQVNAQNKTARDLCSNDVRLTAMLDKVGTVKELREKIRKNGASLSPQDIGGYLDKGVQVNSVDTNGNSILSLAVQNKMFNRSPG